MRAPQNDAEEYALLIATELQELERGIHDGEVYADEYDALDVWVESCVLDVDVTASLTTGGIASVTVVRTVGGPGCWIECQGDGTVRVVTAWGGDRAATTVDAPTVDAWAWDRAELMLADPPADRYR